MIKYWTLKCQIFRQPVLPGIIITIMYSLENMVIYSPLEYSIVHTYVRRTDEFSIDNRSTLWLSDNGTPIGGVNSKYKIIR